MKVVMFIRRAIRAQRKIEAGRKDLEEIKDALAAELVRTGAARLVLADPASDDRIALVQQRAVLRSSDLDELLKVLDAQSADRLFPRAERRSPNWQAIDEYVRASDDGDVARELLRVIARRITYNLRIMEGKRSAKQSSG